MRNWFDSRSDDMAHSIFEFVEGAPAWTLSAEAQIEPCRMHGGVEILIRCGVPA
jgi:hypothetical protein